MRFFFAESKDLPVRLSRFCPNAVHYKTGPGKLFEN